VAALAAGLVIGFALYPSFPTFDSVYSLVWGREIAHLHAPSLHAYRAPTEHPLGILAGALLSPLGDGAGRAFEFLVFASFAALVAGAYRLGRQAFTPLVGLAAALILLSRFDFANFAVRGYIDIPYVACLVWAVSLEIEEPRRGGAVWVLLIAAGLMRPEAWVLAVLYAIWLRATMDPHPSTPGSRPGLPLPLDEDEGRPWPSSLVSRILGWGPTAALALGAPAIWLGLDLLFTGDPLFSFHATSETVGELGRSRSLVDLPGATLSFLGELLKPPMVAAGVVGLGVSALLFPRRIVGPTVLLLVGLGMFLAIGGAGLAVIDRYVLVPAAALCVFAGFTLGGFSLLQRGWPKLAWAAGAAAVALAVVVFTLGNTLRVTSFRDELAFRTDVHDSLVDVLRSPAVREARAKGCVPISTPTHKAIPDVRLALGLPESAVVSRSDPEHAAEAGRGLALYVHGRRAMDLEGFDPATDPLTEVPSPGFERLAGGKYFTVFARCQG
jgi:hypothetical protein